MSTAICLLLAAMLLPVVKSLAWIVNRYNSSTKCKFDLSFGVFRVHSAFGPRPQVRIANDLTGYRIN